MVSNSSAGIAVQSRDKRFTTSLSAVITRSITDYQPNLGFDISNWSTLKNISPADPTFFKSQKIDLLVVASLFFDQTRMADNLPILQKTKPGWLALGGHSAVRNGIHL